MERDVERPCVRVRREVEVRLDVACGGGKEVAGGCKCRGEDRCKPVPEDIMGVELRQSGALKDVVAVVIDTPPAAANTTVAVREDR